MQLPQLLESLEAGERRIADIAALEPALLGRSYAPGKWTANQILSHLADTELVYCYRFMKALAEEGALIVPFDQDRWVDQLGGATRPPQVSLAMIRGVRAMVRHLLVTASAEQLARITHHPERGDLTPLTLATSLASHASHHLDQLEAIRDGRQWTPR